MKESKVISQNNENDKIRILQFPIANSKGGMTQYVLQNWKFIDKSKFHFDFATMSKSLDFADVLENEGCKIHYISCYAEEDKAKFICQFKRILIEYNYDVVHLHTKQWKSFLVEQIAKEVGVKKVIVHAHNTGIDTLDEGKREEEVRLHNQCLQQLTEETATDFWACSWKAAEFLFGDKIQKNKIKIMNNAIDLQKYCFNQKIRSKYREELGISNKFVIGNVGRFEYQKNHEFLINVFYELTKRISDARLLLLGDGQLFTQIQNKIESLDLRERVILLGKRADVEKWYQVMDVFCLPSRFEGLPISMIEAQAAGLPCIVSDCITNEVKIDANVTMLPLKMQLWLDHICKYNDKQHSKGIFVKRENAWKHLEQSGYNILEQIKRVEKNYVM